MNSGFALQGFVADRIVVSDWGLGRPIWYNVDDRSKESLNPFYQWLGVKKAKKIQGDVMDMWKVFEKSTRTENRPTLV